MFGFCPRDAHEARACESLFYELLLRCYDHASYTDELL